MILSLICLTALQAPNAKDFFPATPGMVRTYEQKGGGSSIVVNKIGKLMDIGGASVIPITESGSGTDKTTYYKADNDQITIYAFDVMKPMANPMPVLKIGTGKIAWDYEGDTGTGSGRERLREHGESHLAGQKSILGKKVDILISTLAAVVGMGMAGETFEQKTVYAKGIGMVEQSTKIKIGKKTMSETSFRLISVEPPKD